MPQIDKPDATLEELQRDNEKLRSWIKAANQFAWAHERDCPGYESGGSACTCGLDKFLGRPKLFIESYKGRISELEAQAASQAKLIAGYIDRQIDDQHLIAGLEKRIADLAEDNTDLESILDEIDRILDAPKSSSSKYAVIVGAVKDIAQERARLKELEKKAALLQLGLDGKNGPRTYSLEQERDVLLKDKERLDWLSSRRYLCYGNKYIDSSIIQIESGGWSAQGANLRDAIDAAMKAGKES